MEFCRLFGRLLQTAPEETLYMGTARSLLPISAARRPPAVEACFLPCSSFDRLFPSRRLQTNHDLNMSAKSNVTAQEKQSTDVEKLRIVKTAAIQFRNRRTMLCTPRTRIAILDMVAVRASRVMASVTHLPTAHVPTRIPHPSHACPCCMSTSVPGAGCIR